MEFKSMREVTKESVLVDVLDSLPGSGPGSAYRVLVLDGRAIRVLSASLRMFDMTERGVALVESLEKKRAPFADLEAVYCLAPTAASVERLVKDFADPAKPQYGRAHVFFLEHCPDAVLADIQSAAALVQRLGTLTEMNLNFLAVEENVFHLDMQTAFVDLYNESASKRRLCMDAMVNGLVTACATLNEYPFVRHGRSGLAEELAGAFQRRFNGLIVSNNNDYWWHGDGGDGHGDMGQRATLLIVDRAEDASTPLLHAFTYQAMIHDLLNVKDDLCRYYKGDVTAGYRGQDEDPALLLDAVPDPKSPVGACLLNEDDPLWTDFRHMHIAGVIEALNSDLEKYMDTSIAKMNREDREGFEASLEEMNKAVQQLPEYEALMARHVIHLQLSRLCMHKLERRKLLTLATLEQDMVEGVDGNGKEVSKSVLATRLMELAQDPAVGVLETLRLLGVYMVSQQGIKESDRRRIIEACNPPLPPATLACLLNLSQLGVSVQQSSASASASASAAAKASGSAAKEKQLEKLRLAEAKKVALAAQNPYGRHVPRIASIVDQVCKRTLGTDDFPFVIEPPPNLMLAAAATSHPGAAAPSNGAGKSLTSGFGSSFVAAFGKSSTKSKAATAASSSSSSSSSASSASSAAAAARVEGVVLSVRSKPKNGAQSSNVKSSDADSAAGLRQTKQAKRRPRGARVIVFVAGGATYAELAAIHKVMADNNRDIVVGTTHLTTPTAFLHDLQFLEAERLPAYYKEKEKEEKARHDAAQARMKRDAEAAGAAAPQDQDDDQNQNQNQGGGDHDNKSQTVAGERKKKNKKSFGGFFGCGCIGPPPPPKPTQGPVNMPPSSPSPTPAPANT